MISHMSNIDAIISELESTGFKWNTDSVKGLLYQLHMPAEMTKEVNKELDNRTDKKSPVFEHREIKGAIQMYLAREKTASDTISICNLNSQVEALSMTSRRFQSTP